MEQKSGSTLPTGGASHEDGYDLIVIGAGINGAGIARDAAMRGLRVLLLEKGDVGAETSRWSSRLIHGGLRYLEHGEIGLVRESLRERERLLRQAPHLVKPLALLIPVYRGRGRGWWTVRAGMWGYDLLSFDKSLPWHRMFSRDQALERAPGLEPKGLRGAAMYHDAQVPYAERLVLVNALDARRHGATVKTYCRVERLLRSDDRVEGVEYTDLRGGGTHTVRAPVTVNVAGPWVDRVLSGLGGEDRPKRLIGGTKGSHIITGAFPGAPSDAIYTEAADGRPFFILPWAGQYLIGTTDLRYEADPGEARATAEEIDYLIEGVNAVLPGAGLSRAAVRYTYAGIRPLPHTAGGPAGAITRRHIIHDFASEAGVEGVLSIVGGKLTTYRSLAEQTVDRVYAKLGRSVPGCPTREAPLPGAPRGEDFGAFREGFAEECTLSERTVAHLLDVYGMQAAEVQEIAEGEPGLKEPFCPHTGAIGAELVWAFESEMARTLADAMLRRTMAGLGPNLGRDVVEKASRIVAKSQGWDEARREAEVAGYRREIERFMPAGAEGSAS